MGGAGDTCSQPQTLESFICSRNSFVGIPKPIIGPHRNVALIKGIKKIQGNQLLAIGGAGDTFSQPHPRESFICGRNSFVGIPKPIIGPHRNVALIIGIKKNQGNQLLAMGKGWRHVFPAPPTGIVFLRPEFFRRNSET
ncbi:unnamed protein product [Macrosiphum euphorbiae]|uniref:Uncharacterized protein n=1 Tax=Macrosiphum euphorbiae TaxID=13131 RepID=A0AAV0Y2X9_9HEMI|nr:unnamed protein product [Macrosiphum euphorbiae]